MSNTTWMSDPAVQGLTLRQLALPGTHDSGSYSVETGALSQIDYANIVFLWQISAAAAAADGKNPMTVPLPGMPNLSNPINEANSLAGFSGLNTLYVGPTANDFIMSIAKDLSQSNDRSLLDQLNDGLRYFDLRLYWDFDEGDFYVQHGLRGAKAARLIADVNSFLTANPTSSELIVLDVNHMNLTNDAPQLTTLAQMFENGLPSGAFYVPKALSDGTDTFLALADTKVSDITRGSNKVLLLNTDTKPSPPAVSNLSYPAPFINTAGYSRAPDTDSGTNSVQTLSTWATTAIDGLTTTELGRLSWSLTCQTEDAIADALGRLAGGPDFVPALQRLATTANENLARFIDLLTEDRKNKLSCLTVDWHEKSPDAPTVVELAITLCRIRAMSSHKQAP